MDTIIIEILKIGTIPAILIYFMFNIDKLNKLIGFITKPFFLILNWFPKAHIGSKISGYLFDFTNNHIISFLPGIEKFSFKIKWVSSPEDPILNENNSIIIRLKEDKDQTRNILMATKLALPQVICPYIRNNISKNLETSVDLVVLRKMANMLGNHGKLIFKKYFLDNEIKESIKLQTYFQQLVELDNRGYFISIFINELDYLGKGLYADSNLTDVTESIEKLLEFLIVLCNWRKGDGIIPLDYNSKNINLGIILLAITERTINEGLRPYVKRINKKFSQGSHSVYIIAEPEVWDFYKKLLKALESSDRFFIRKSVLIKPNKESNKKDYPPVMSATLRKIDISPDDAFEQKIKSLDLKEGDEMIGEVYDVSDSQALITAKGMDCFIKADSCSWNTVFSCHDYLDTGENYDFVIQRIDSIYSSIELTLRTKTNDPWLIHKVPEIGDIVKAKLTNRKNNHVIGMTNNIEINIPVEELSWGEPGHMQIDSYLNKEYDIKILNKDNENHIIKGSIRETIEDPWPVIHKNFPKGKEVNGKVIEVNENFIRLDIGNGINGIIPKESMKAAGYEYSDYKNNVVIGQGFDVVVSKVFLEKRKIRFELKRNL